MAGRESFKEFSRGGPLKPINLQSSSQAKRLEWLDTSPEEIEVVREVAREMMERLDGSDEIRLRADFRGESSDDQFFQRIQRLRKRSFVHMTSVEILRRTDETLIDLRLASSGELGIVTGFLGLASVIDKNCLVFVDEPEISLHPEWQARYIDLLTRTFSHFTGCHYILATHSPLILSDIDPESSNVVSLDPDHRRAENAHKFAGKSSDFLLATTFGEPGKNNLYLKERIIKALRLVADGQISSPEFNHIYTLLTENLKHLDSDSPVARLIVELKEAVKVGG